MARAGRHRKAWDDPFRRCGTKAKLGFFELCVEKSLRFSVLIPVILAAPAVAQTPPAAVAATPHARLTALFAASDEATIQALERGDLRYADRLGDMISDAYYAAEKAAAEQDLAGLQAIDRAALSPTDRIAYDVFEWQTKLALKGFEPRILAANILRPIDHFEGLHIVYPDLASGQGAAPFKTVADYENNLKRHQDFIRYLDAAIGRFRQGMKAGIVQPKLVVRNMIDQLDLQIAQGIDGSPYMAPALHFPDAIGPADRARLRAAYAQAIATGIVPALTRLRDFLRQEYLPAAREAIGLHAMKDGDAYYAYLIEQNTTLPLTAAEVHTLGLSEVARILTELEALKRQVGFQGSLQDFFTRLRTDPRFQPKTKAELRDGYFAIRTRVMKRIPEQFSTIPKSPLEILPDPPYREKTSAGGEYNAGTPDGSRPGIFYYNGYDLPSRYTWEMETLFLHEAIPGHHFQISLAQENTELPNFLRFGGNTAYQEGWALYTESLWHELGMETDPYQRIGGLSDEMLRAMRLVVDSGIHALGWSRDQSIDYMLANSPMSRTDATAEVERYIAIPGQALAYKIGALTIQRCKAKAMAALGPKFDPRAFHAEVLMTGALPMPVLERKIDDWIARRKTG
jgi:uncharacterized protein (DUF885 family)